MSDPTKPWPDQTQVREHAKALILDCARDGDDALTISEHLFDHYEGNPPLLDGPDVDDLIAAIGDAIRTANITVDWAAPDA